MPLSIRPSRRFLVQCSGTCNAGLFTGIGVFALLFFLFPSTSAIAGDFADEIERFATSLFVHMFLVMYVLVVAGSVIVVNGKAFVGGTMQLAAMGIAMWGEEIARREGDTGSAMGFSMAVGFLLASFFWNIEVLRLLRESRKEQANKTWSEIGQLLKHEATTSVRRFLVYALAGLVIFGFWKLASGH